MRERLFKLAAIGFPLGVAIGVFLLLVPFGGTEGAPRLASEALVRRIGSERGAFLVQMLLSGLLGSISMAGSLCYEIESWSMVRSALTHWALIMAAYFVIALFCGWLHPEPVELLLMAGIMSAAYLLIFLIMYIRCRKEAKELNLQIRDKKMKKEE